MLVILPNLSSYRAQEDQCRGILLLGPGGGSEEVHQSANVCVGQCQRVSKGPWVEKDRKRRGGLP